MFVSATIATAARWVLGRNRCDSTCSTSFTTIPHASEGESRAFFGRAVCQRRPLFSSGRGRTRFDAESISFVVLSKKIAVAGGSGFVGRRLVRRLESEGNSVVVLTRKPSKIEGTFPTSVKIIQYDPYESGPWQSELDGVDAVVNLVGDPISEGRWTAEKKQNILDSRIKTTEKIVEAIEKAQSRPSVLVNGSAIGFYGTSETATFTEKDGSGDDFLSEICIGWEGAASKVTSLGTRLVIIRTGIVLGDEGGALAKMIPIFKLFAGGPIGTGMQWFSWVHADDIVALIEKAVNDPSMSGAYNGTAPNPVRMSTLCAALGRVMGRPSWLPVPSFALEALLGEGAQVVLNGQQVLPERSLAAGMKYEYPTIEEALTEILGK